ncbi:mannose-6-phosphate isomerase, class I [Compostimonas suwonensis]|uniref:mannose-6-phosphate isomerase n=1 Tax=Compostimonas suwonensis TaxID=1048394 RepID=A0A2M9BUT9_9MICO|nr:mannose-6-phosphate isomerase, class I [Compostimonas suwonensis]PJJ61721.1 mannose-6-phosphate isomerase [Compostimonas suwonensis]
MFVRITNTPRDYAWGSTTAIAELLGHEPSGGPEAELWLGAHPGSPSRIVDPSQTGGAADLAAWIAADPQTALGSRLASAGAPRLPFLLKILAAASPLSLQAHPSNERARAGFAEENALGIPLDAPHRNYKDEHHKPEMVYALSETFEALCGFRPLDEVREMLAELHDASEEGYRSTLGPLAALVERLNGEQPLRTAVEWLLGSGTRSDAAAVTALVGNVVALAEAVQSSRFAKEFETVVQLAESYPGDPGIVISLLLNRVSLRRGEALFLPAGNIHAYLSGLGVELMAASDNVLRGGLSPKHIDVDELVEVLEFESLPVPYLPPAVEFNRIAVYRPDVTDFELVRAIPSGDPSAALVLAGPAIAIAIEGTVEVRGAAASVTLQRGESVYITPDEQGLVFDGAGTVFLATTP